VKLNIWKISDFGGFEQVEVRGKRAQTFIYCSTLALVQLFVEIVKLSPQKIQRNKFVKENRESIEILYFQHGIFNFN
jgi:hypothetical protein